MILKMSPLLERLLQFALLFLIKQKSIYKQVLALGGKWYYKVGFHLLESSLKTWVFWLNDL